LIAYSPSPSKGGEEMKIKPQYDWCQVKVTKITSVGKIQLAESSQKDEEVVEVIAVGPDCERVKKGDRVVCVPLTGQNIPIDGSSDVVFVREENIIAIIED
jgi:co-chaperonin GroES (HSP10)